jgi:hypothetical protein
VPLNIRRAEGEGAEETDFAAIVGEANHVRNEHMRPPFENIPSQDNLTASQKAASEAILEKIASNFIFCFNSQND